MNLVTFASQLEHASSLAQVEASLNLYLSTFGFRHFAFTYYSGHTKSGRKLHYDYVSDALRPWHVYYLEQFYADADRTLEENHTRTLPLFWEVNIQLLNAKNKREKRIREESIGFGIDKGLSIPIHGPNYDFASLTLHQCRDQTSLHHYELHQFEWLSAGHIFYHYIKKLLMPIPLDPTIYQLTKREEQCLLLTAKSWRVEQIAKELKISERTVNFHLQNANKKLGKNNKYQTAFTYFKNW